MPIVYACKACGCSVSDMQLQSAQAIRHGRDVYCSECSALILEPAESRPGAKAGAVFRKLEQQPSVSAPGSTRRPRESDRSELVRDLSMAEPPDQGASGGNRRLKRDGIEVLEEFEILGGGSAPPPAAVEDQEAGVETGEVQPTKLPSSRSSVASRKSRRGMSKERSAPQARRDASPPKRELPVGRPARAVPVASKSKSLGKDGKRKKEVFYQSGLQARMEPEEPAPAPESEAQSVDSNILEAVRAQKKERVQSTSRKASRNSNAESRGSRRSTREPERRNTTPMIYLGIAIAVLLVGLLIFKFSSGGKTSHKAAEKQAVPEAVSPSEFARKGEEALKSGDRMGAMDLYQKAGLAAEAAGNVEEARRYTMRAYDIQKFTKIDVGHR